jgi:hypothetical protein
LRDELLNGEIFNTLPEAKIIIESWRRHYNAARPHLSIGYKPLAPEVFVPRLHRVAGFATSTGFAGHAGAIATLKLTLPPGPLNLGSSALNLGTLTWLTFSRKLPQSVISLDKSFGNAL